VESPILKKQLDALYSKYSSHQFLYICLEIPGRNIDVNVHPTKNRVCFLNEEKISGSIVDYIETKLKNVDDSRVFYIQVIMTN
jgi:DNA mismatch repair protein MLH1